jgi:hypothetical protein
MGRLRAVPFVAVAVLAALAVLGARGKAFNVPAVVTCAYQLGALDAPGADVLFIGSSRTGRGIDHGYIMSQLKADTGRDIRVERLVMTRPEVPQFRPLIRRYVEQRGAPKEVFLQLLYNFDPDRQSTWDVPVNGIRNIAMTDLAEMAEIQTTAQLNDHGTVLPRTLENGYLSLPVVALTKLEANIYSALRWPGQKLLGRLDPCQGRQLQIQANDRWVFNSVTDDLAFSLTDRQQRILAVNARRAAKFLPMAPTDPMRRFENDQMHHIISELQAAGSRVHLLLMPALGDTELSQAEREDLETAFPGLRIVQPYDLFKGAAGAELAQSFADTHHATPFGALQYSRYFASVIAGLDQ